jgi:hypothetical protein
VCFGTSELDVFVHCYFVVFNTKRKSVGFNQYFYDTNAPEENNDMKYRKKRQKVEFDQSKCWFCLASPSVEKHLIVTVANSTYLALAKGMSVDATAPSGVNTDSSRTRRGRALLDLPD